MEEATLVEQLKQRQSAALEKIIDRYAAYVSAIVRNVIGDCMDDYSDPNGERMEVGFIRNGEPVSGYFDKAKEFSYSVTADEAGEYYFYIQNWTAGYVTVSSGSIDLQGSP